MRAISKGKDDCIHVGDATHYDTYHFMPGVSSIRYPQTLDWWEISSVSTVEDCIPPMDSPGMYQWCERIVVIYDRYLQHE